jgi:beta-galactosidase
MPGPGDFPDAEGRGPNPGGSVPRLPGLTRRQAIQAGAVAAGSLAALGATSGAAGAGEESGPVAPPGRPGHPGRSERSFDEGWLFYRGDAAGAEAASFGDSGWRALDLPHDWSIEDLPYATSQDGAATDDPSLLVYQSGGPAEPAPPSVIGPFDEQESAGGGSTGYMAGGVGWYRKHFTLPGFGGTGTGPGGQGSGGEHLDNKNLNPQGAGGERHAEVRFDGVYQNADVWLNGTHLGFHPYGYTGFAYDLTPHLNPAGPNVLAVRVDNSGKTSRWYSGSGIYRHTWLTLTGPVRIPLWGVQVTTPVAGRRRSVAHVEVSVANLGAATAAARARVTVLGPDGRPVATAQTAAADVAPGATAVLTADIAVSGAKLWSPGSPSLYTARADVLVDGAVADSVTTVFGIRSLVWNAADGFLLNGEPVKALGGCVHDTHGPLGAVGLDRTEERRVEVLKAAGFNAIRTAHNPPAPALLDACDRLGMLVWDEFTDVWDTGKNPQDYSVHFPQWWPQDLTSMILRDRNHPSVVIWSLGNEIVEDSHYAQRGRQMAALVRSLDQTRPVTLGGGSTAGPDDPSWQYVDVGDVHYNAGGNGYGAIHAAHPDAALTQSESFPATVYDDWVTARASAWAVGNWVWAAWDYLGESGLGKTPVAPEGTWKTIYDQTTQPGWSAGRALYRSYGGYGYGYPWFQSNCGDIDLIGQRKPQNYWRAAVYGFSPVEILAGRPTPAGTEQEAVWWGYYDEQPSWTWDVQPGQPMTVHVYTQADSVTLLLNGAEVPGGVAVPDKDKATFTVPYAAGDLTAIARRGGKEIGRKTLSTAGAPAALRLTPDVGALTTSRDALAHVLAEVTDGHGRLVPDAVLEVTFQAGGAGELAGVANGNPHNLDSFRQPHRYTWHGQALAILRPAKQPGSVRLTARAAGLRGATLALPVRPG